MWEEGGYLGVWVGGSSGIIVCLSGGDPVIRLTVMSVTVSSQSTVTIYSHSQSQRSHNELSQSVKVSHNSHKIYSQ